MPLFKKESKNYLGIDLGGSVIKLVELKNEAGKATLVTYGYAQKPVSMVSGDFIERPGELVKLLKDLCDKSHVTTKKVVTALPASSVFSTVINLPNISKNDLKDTEKISGAVEWEAKKVVPMPLDEMAIDWKLLPAKSEKDGDKYRGAQILLTGASKKLVKKYMDIFAESGLELLSLETESFALIRSLIGNDKSVIMLVDVGALNTYLIIVDSGVPFLDRTLNTGGLNITKAIASSLNVSIEKAEQFKLDLAVSSAAKNMKMPKLIENILAPIIHEIKYTYNIYSQDEYGGKKIEKIILTGGTALLPNLPTYLSELLSTRAYLGDPWARIIYPEDLKTVLNDIGSQFAVSIGLAMRDIE